MRFGPDFTEAHTLGDGTRVTLRFLRPDDAEELRRGYRELSPESRYRRFLTGEAELTDERLRYLTETDGVRHVAIVATTESLDLKSERGLGVARFVRLPTEADVAEAAVTVIDGMQHKGVGRLLLGLLARVARDRGVRAFRAEVLASNAPMRELLHAAGAVVRVDEGATLTFDVPLGGPADGAHPEGTARRVLRAVAASLSSLAGG